MAHSYTITRMLASRRCLRLATCLAFLLLASPLAELVHADHCEADTCQACSATTVEGPAHSLPCAAAVLASATRVAPEAAVSPDAFVARPYDVRGPPPLS